MIITKRTFFIWFFPLFAGNLLLTACAFQTTIPYPYLSSFRDTLGDLGQGPAMVVLPPGQFIMGSASDEPERNPFEVPQHTVIIKKPFAMSQYEITFQEYDVFVDATQYTKPSDKGWGSEYWGRTNTPVFNVSWYDAQAYVTWLSEQTGHQYRLATEAEWEYAARAGSQTPFYTGRCLHTDQANYHGRTPFGDCPVPQHYRGQTTAVGTFAPNAWGLYDMYGNIFEWTEDCWHDNYHGAPADGSAWIDNHFTEPTDSDFDTSCDEPKRVLRGGSWSGFAHHMRSAYRGVNNPEHKSIFIGFRVVREL